MLRRSRPFAHPALTGMLAAALGCAPADDDTVADAPTDPGGEESRREVDAEPDADARSDADFLAEAETDARPDADFLAETDVPVEPGFHETTRGVVGNGRHPRLSADEGGRLHLTVDDGARLFYRTWNGSWSAPEPVPGSDGVGANKWGRHRIWVAPDGARVQVSWGTGWDTDVFYAWRDGGGWHGPETACPRSVRAWEFAATAGGSDGDAYVFCMFDDLWVAHRSPAGVWDAPTHLWTGGAKHVAAVTGPDDRIHLAFRFARVYYANGDGSSWSPIREVTTHGDSAELPAIALGPDGLVHLAWQRWLDHGGGAWAIDSVRYARGNDDTWSGGGPGVLVHEYEAPANPPELAVDDGGRVVTAWVEGDAVLLAAAVAGGESFLGPWTVAEDPAAVHDGALENDLATPPLAFVGTALHFVYEDDAGRIAHVSGTVAP
ncbi:MAG: hypothetical protein JXB32_21175 [Deltaproteobacteria bacterium]|nr:hypothetical protein [Deltaproteobacteria bacterium]